MFLTEEKISGRDHGEEFLQAFHACHHHQERQGLFLSGRIVKLVSDAQARVADNILLLSRTHTGLYLQSLDDHR